MITTAKITNEAYRIRLDHKENPAPKLTRLLVAKNDTAAFQILVQSEAHYSVSVRPVEHFSSTYTATHKHHERVRVEVKAPFPAELHLEGLMPDHDGTEKADVLLSQDVLESRANVPTGVYCEIKVPATATPGDYTVTVTVRRSLYGEDEQVILNEEIPLCVANYEMPDPANSGLYLNLWQHLTSVARYHDVPLFSDAHFTVLEEYVRAIAALGQKSVTICAGEIPWGGQGCAGDHEHGGNLFEYSIIGITKRKDGSFTYDYSNMQRYIDLCAAHGITGDIEIFGLVNVWQKLIAEPLCPDYPESVVLRYLDEADGCLKYMRKRDEIIAYVQALEDYFKKTGQIARVRIGADEPGDVERYRASLALLGEIAPSFLCSTAINHAEFVEEFQHQISTAAPSLSCMISEYERLTEHKKNFPQKKLLWYVCGYASTPNNSIINPLTDNRAIGSLTDLLGADGFLRWNFCLYPEDPRRDVNYGPFGAGDVNFVYPAKNGRVLLSLRYKALQRGFGDFALLKALRGKNPDAADEALTRIFAFDRNSLSEFGEHRKALGRALDYTRDKDYISRDWNDYNEMKAALLVQLAKEK